MANLDEEILMLENYFSAPKTLRRLRTGPSGPYIDGFSNALERDRYARASAVRYLRAAAHLGCFVHRKGYVWGDINEPMLEAFARHLPRCRCPLSNGGKTGYHARFGVKLFYQHLVQRGICQDHSIRGAQCIEPALVSAFRDWFQMHRGATPSTLQQYTRDATDLIRALGEDVGQWNAGTVRDYLLDRAGRCAAPTTQHLITSLRAFLRYLNFRGESRDDLALAVPAIAHWRLATLPHCLSAQELDRLLAACDGTTPGRLRDRAILLLLSRLGLRAADVAQLRLSDIDWTNGTLRVMGKGRYQVRLPLPQDLGDALARYLDCRPRLEQTDLVFPRSIAPCKPFASGDGVSSVVRQALRRAGIEAPAKGAHLLRHTAATEMLRHGVPLDQIGLVLRHRSIDMSAYYAKVDVALLQQIAQPWPGANS